MLLLRVFSLSHSVWSVWIEISQVLCLWLQQLRRTLYGVCGLKSVISLVYFVRCHVELHTEYLNWTLIFSASLTTNTLTITEKLILSFRRPLEF